MGQFEPTTQNELCRFTFNIMPLCPRERLPQYCRDHANNEHVWRKQVQNHVKFQAISVQLGCIAGIARCSAGCDSWLGGSIRPRLPTCAASTRTQSGNCVHDLPGGSHRVHRRSFSGGKNRSRLAMSLDAGLQRSPRLLTPSAVTSPVNKCRNSHDEQCVAPEPTGVALVNRRRCGCHWRKQFRHEAPKRLRSSERQGAPLPPDVNRPCTIRGGEV